MPKRKSTYEGTPVTLTIRLSEKLDKILCREVKERRTHKSKVIREIMEKHYGVEA